MGSGRGEIDPELDGSGGGYGKFKGLTVREVSKLFENISQEGNMRSVSGILRICHEQLESRSQLAVSTQAAVVLGVVTGALCIAFATFHGKAQAFLGKAVAISGVLFAGFLSGALSTRKMARAAVAQERAICDLALDALEQVVSSPGFKAKPLDSLQKATLKRLMAKTKRGQESLAALLTG